MAQHVCMLSYKPFLKVMYVEIIHSCFKNTSEKQTVPEFKELLSSVEELLNILLVEYFVAC